MIRLTLALFLFTQIHPEIFSQTPEDKAALVTAGSNVVSGKRFHNYENVWRMTEIDSLGVEKIVGHWYDTLRIISNGKKFTSAAKDRKGVIVRTQHAKYTNGFVRRHLDVVNFDNLLPIQTKILSQDDKGIETIIAEITYKEHLVSGYRNFNIEGSGPQQELGGKVNIALDAPVFDWHLWGILVAGFPLRENYQAKFLAHTSTNTTSSPFLWIDLKVTGSESVVSKKWGTVDCWVVSVDAEVPWTFWIAKTSQVPPIQMIKIDQSPLGGTTAWWKPLE